LKTQLISLDPHDDITSVRDKMAWGKTTRILILWPETGEIVLDRRLDVLLLKRRAVELGAQLAFVTHDPEVKSHARELGIPSFRTSREAQAAHWRIRREKSRLDIIRRLRATHGPKFTPRHTPYTIPDTQSLPRIPYSVFRIPFFLLALLSVAALAGLLFPSATITLTPAKKIQTLTFTTLTSPTITTLNSSGGIPARPITIIVEGRTIVETTGHLTLPNAPATGRVTFINLTDVTVIIPSGTIVATASVSTGDSPIRFITDRQAQLPAQAGGTVDVPITAIQPGTGGNLEAGAIQSVEGTLGLQMTVTNAASTDGGTDQTLAAPTDLDRRRAYRQLLDSLRETAAAEILAQLSPGDLLLNPTPFLLTALEETYSPAETIPTDLLEASVRLEFQALAITQADLQTLSQMVLDASLETGYEPVPDTLTYQLLTDPEPDAENNATWEMKAERELIATLPGRVAVDLALGQPPAFARTLLAASLPLSIPPEIQLTPTWWPWMPFLPFQIEIVGTR
jgi:hypothetical protein